MMVSFLLFVVLVAAEVQEPPKTPPPAAQEKEQKSKSKRRALEPSLESLMDEEPDKPKEYTLNPAQAEQEIKVGTYYLKKGNTSAAIKRYEEATRELQLAEGRGKLIYIVAFYLDLGIFLEKDGQRSEERRVGKECRL